MRKALKQAMLAFAPLTMLADHADRWIAQSGTFRTFEFWHPGALGYWGTGALGQVARHEGCVRVPLLSPQRSGRHQAVQATPLG